MVRYTKREGVQPVTRVEYLSIIYMLKTMLDNKLYNEMSDVLDKIIAQSEREI